MSTLWMCPSIAWPCISLALKCQRRSSFKIKHRGSELLQLIIASKAALSTISSTASCGCASVANHDEERDYKGKITTSRNGEFEGSRYRRNVAGRDNVMHPGTTRATVDLASQPSWLIPRLFLCIAHTGGDEPICR